MRAILTAAAVLLAFPAWSSCYQRDHLAGYLEARHGLALHSWGLSDAGDMMELFLSDGGHWAVVTTKPNRCASVAFPHKERGRLWMPPKQNWALPDGLWMDQGTPL